MLTVGQLHVDLDELDGREEDGLSEARDSPRDAKEQVVAGGSWRRRQSSGFVLMKRGFVVLDVLRVKELASVLFHTEEDGVDEHGTDQRTADSFVKSARLKMKDSKIQSTCSWFNGSVLRRLTDSLVTIFTRQSIEFE